MNICYDKLWKLLIDKKLNKTQLRQQTGISSNSLAKLGKNESVNLDVLLKICEELDANIEDVVEFEKIKNE
ncbi:MAG: XRE family transcriptional regulator [Clostridia bacterium]|nr:XRE family transcriptional regulator [Clostridia bacterium]